MSQPPRACPTLVYHQQHMPRLQKPKRAKQSEDLSLQILSLIRETQRRNRSVSRAEGTPLSLLDSHILMELLVAPGTSFQTLSELLGVSKSTISRSVDALVKLGLLRAERKHAKGRPMEVEVTESGQALIEARDRTANQLDGERQSTMSNEEQRLFLTLLNIFASSLANRPLAPLRAGEHPIRPAARAITRALGLLGSNVFGIEDMTDLKWHILTELRTRPRASGHLAQNLSVPATTLSTALTPLEEEGRLRREVDENDKRKVAVTLTSAGRSLLNRLEGAAKKYIEHGCRSLSKSEVAQFVTLFTKLVYGRDQEEQQAFTPGLVRLLDPHELLRARHLIIRSLGQCSDEVLVPAVIAGQESLVYGSFFRGVLNGVAELQREKAGFTLAFLILPSAEAIPHSLEQLFLEVCQSLFAQFPRAKLQIERVIPPLPAVLRNALPFGCVEIRSGDLPTIIRAVRPVEE